MSIWQVPGSILGLETGYSDRLFRFVLKWIDKYQPDHHGLEVNLPGFYSGDFGSIIVSNAGCLKAGPKSPQTNTSSYGTESYLFNSFQFMIC